MTANLLSVERLIAAEPSAIFAVVSDASRHQEIDGSGTVKGLKSDPQPLALGSVFGMRMRMGFPYATKNTVVEFEQDRQIAWKVSFGPLIGGQVWRYQLTPVEGGTLVTESRDNSANLMRGIWERKSLRAKTEKAITRTLENLAGVTER